MSYEDDGQPVQTYFSQDPFKEQIEGFKSLPPTKQIIVDFRNNLKGLEWDESQGKFIKIGEQRYSDKFIDDFVNILSSFINESNVHSDFNKYYIKNVMIELSTSMNCKICEKLNEYGIKKSDFQITCKSISVMVKGAMNRALDKTTLKYKSTVTHESISQNLTPPRQESAGLGKLLHLGGK